MGDPFLLLMIINFKSMNTISPSLMVKSTPLFSDFLELAHQTLLYTDRFLINFPESLLDFLFHFAVLSLNKQRLTRKAWMVFLRHCL